MNSPRDYLVLNGTPDVRILPGDHMVIERAWRRERQPVALAGVFRVNGQRHDYALPELLLQEFEMLQEQSGTVERVARLGRDLAIRLRRDN